MKNSGVRLPTGTQLQYNRGGMKNSGVTLPTGTQLQYNRGGGGEMRNYKVMSHFKNIAVHALLHILHFL